ncbi:MAG TPA: methylated-DNA--[protein]-cysteine S-methyltransferase [Pseudomonadales bacterium]|jgi:methylated-DNA-[protein]-cysteine S-methyltransferase|nr:methylated-DNA--[protein]-cysteine S-methyltransferase [Pseudomonadales bacterium]|tara:strand:+ start:2284 stop:2769 length:486 start_codon:yes stop_codon:yes gene_type:complete
MYYTYATSPIGQLLLAGSADALQVIGFPHGDKARRADIGWERYDEPFKKTARQLNEYFAGDRQEFELDLAPDGTTFQVEVLEALRGIPYGETCTYRDIAVAVGRPKAVRAVGNANGRNPLPIVIPCHRVIGSDGSLTGFGGGIEVKRYLLDLEQQHCVPFA